MVTWVQGNFACTACVDMSGVMTNPDEGSIHFSGIDRAPFSIPRTYGCLFDRAPSTLPFRPGLASAGADADGIRAVRRLCKSDRRASARVICGELETVQ